MKVKNRLVCWLAAALIGTVLAFWHAAVLFGQRLVVAKQTEVIRFEDGKSAVAAVFDMSKGYLISNESTLGLVVDTSTLLAAPPDYLAQNRLLSALERLVVQAKGIEALASRPDFIGAVDRFEALRASRLAFDVACRKNTYLAEKIKWLLPDNIKESFCY
ncbi:MAG: hypothetical protein LBL52_00500 [Rickettsiales bacterium]|jgi:hypothetical protein|nr:hypothetical protein [Rickettsiales bacterium]